LRGWDDSEATTIRMAREGKEEEERKQHYHEQMFLFPTLKWMTCDRLEHSSSFPLKNTSHLS
jgi:hypothetical protein